MSEAQKDISRSAGFALSEKIEQDKHKRGKARSLKPLAQLWPFAARYKLRLLLFLLFLALSSLMTLGLSFIGKFMTDCGFGKTDGP